MSRKQDEKYAESHDWCDILEKEMKDESERAVAIIGASVLDEALKVLLRSVLLPCSTSTDPLFDGAYSPLASFSAKIDFACRMGLVEAGVARSLHLVRRIRNDFAHDISGCSFGQAGIRARVRELKKLNDVATPKNRDRFPAGPNGDFQCCVSWLVFWLWRITDQVPSRCPHCSSLHGYDSGAAGDGDEMAQKKSQSDEAPTS